MDFQKLYPSYEKKAFRILLKEFRTLGKKIPYKLLTLDNAESVLKITINQSNIQKALFKVHYMIGNEAGRLQLREFQQWEREVKRIKPNKYPLFSQAYQNWLVDYYDRLGGENIVLLTDTYIKTVVIEMKKSAFLNETQDQMADRIFKEVNKPNFYRWQAMRIARTETTFAVNAGTEISGDFTVIEMQKRWIGMEDGKERADHVAANGQLVGKNEKFTVGGEKLSYPGDKLSGASKQNLINCRCRFSYVPKKDADGTYVLNI